MPGPRIVLFNGGRVNSRDAAMLGEGELTKAQDAYYKPNNPTPFRIPGRSLVTAAGASPVMGVALLKFDAASDLLIALTGTTYRSGVPTIASGVMTATLADLVTGLAGTATTFDHVHYNDEHFLLNGVDRNRVVGSDHIARLHGMAANTGAPTAATHPGTGFTLSSNVTMTYWIEERVKDADGNILRRNGEDGDHTLTITGTGAVEKPRIYHPPFVNSDTTHWAAFATAANGTFPVGGEIGEANIATSYIDDTRTGTDPGIPSGGTYQTVSVTLQGIVELFSKNGPAPIATTGDVLENSVLLNDVTNPRRIVWSFTDEPDVFPFIFFFDFQTKDHDTVKVIRRVGTVGVVLLSEGAWRINTIPTPEDSAFTPERAIVPIDGAFGTVNSTAATTFSFGDSERLAYVSPYGLTVTDGFRWDVLTDDMDWDAEVNKSFLDRIRLVNNPTLYRLEMIYVPAGETDPTKTKTALLHYHPSHAKQSVAGGLRAKMTWPISRDARSVTFEQTGGRGYLLSGNEDGNIYQHDVGSSDAAGETIDFEVRSGDLYTNFVGGQASLKRLLVHHSAAPGQEGSALLVLRRAKVADIEVWRQLDLTYREATPTHGQGLAEAYQVGFRHHASGSSIPEIGLTFIAMDLLPEGASEGR